VSRPEKVGVARSGEVSGPARGGWWARAMGACGGANDGSRGGLLVKPRPLLSAKQAPSARSAMGRAPGPARRRKCA
jgi:hypothetical protein